MKISIHMLSLLYEYSIVLDSTEADLIYYQNVYCFIVSKIVLNFITSQLNVFAQVQWSDSVLKFQFTVHVSRFPALELMEAKKLHAEYFGTEQFDVWITFLCHHIHELETFKNSPFTSNHSDSRTKAKLIYHTLYVQCAVKVNTNTVFYITTFK